MNPTVEVLFQIIVVSLVGGLAYGLIKTLLEMKYPEYFGLDPDWYKDTEESSESESDSEWEIQIEDLD